MPSNLKSATTRRPRRFLRLPEVMERVGLKHTQIYDRMSEGKFPRSVRVGDRAVAWVEDEIDAYQEACIAQRDSAAN